MKKHKALTLSAVFISIMILSACVVDPYGQSICTEDGPNSPGWPYCGSATEPGGPTPNDDPIDPTGRLPA